MNLFNPDGTPAYVVQTKGGTVGTDADYKPLRREPTTLDTARICYNFVERKQMVFAIPFYKRMLDLAWDKEMNSNDEPTRRPDDRGGI